MQLSPEERQKIYEEEKARIESEHKRQLIKNGSSTGLESNIAGLLSYLGGWITGIIFLVIEQNNEFVRFHALQSIVTFGTLTIASIFLVWIPVVGDFFGSIIGILSVILWIILMVKAYQGEMYKIPLAGDVAEGIIPAKYYREKHNKKEEQEVHDNQKTNENSKPPAPPDVNHSEITKRKEDFGKKIEDYFTQTRNGRITGYSAYIFWNIVLLIFFSFFYQYIAWYYFEPDGSVTRLSLLNNDYFIWLPILLTALILSITANIIMIIYDKYWFREIVQIILAVIGVFVTANLLSIFPFDFTVIPNTTLVDIMPVLITIVLIITAVGLGVSALVRFIKLIVYLVK